MVTRYELWDLDAGNMIGVYADQSEALAQVRDLLEANGAPYAADLALGRRGDGEDAPVIEGLALAQLAQSAPVDRTRRSA